MGGRLACDTVKSHLQNAIDTKGFKIHGKDVKVTVQISPSRKAALTCFFGALKHVEASMEKSKFDHSMRDLEIFTLPHAYTIGKWNKDTNKFEWTPETCGQLKLQIVDLAMQVDE